MASESFDAIVAGPGQAGPAIAARCSAEGLQLKPRRVALISAGGSGHEPLDEQSMDDAMDALFAKDGHWQEPPPAWQQPEKSLEQRQFFESLQTCVDRLPPKTGRVSMMREWLEKETEDICAELDITANNCGVMLYRARMQLRECLDRNWFAGQR